MFALSPFVDKMEKSKLPRPLAIFLIYFLVFGFFIGILVSIIPVIISQTALLLDYLPDFVQRLNFLGVPIQANHFSQQLAGIPGNVLKIIAGTFSNLVRFFAYAVITYYLLMEKKNLKRHLHVLFKREGEKRAEVLVERLEKKIGGWVRGQLILMLIVGLLSFTGLSFLGLDFALPLAALAAFLEIVPNIGPTVAAVPAVLIGLTDSSVMGLTVVALYFIIQQLENNLIVPKVMQKSVGLNPLVTLTLLMVGLQLGGVGGAILAVPVFLTIQIVFKELYHSHRSSS